MTQNYVECQSWTKFPTWIALEGTNTQHKKPKEII